MRPPSETVTVEDDDDELTAEIQEQVNEWSSNSNECFTVELVRGDGTVAASFQPEYTHAMFGNEEAIFGYQGLSITLSLTAHDLKPRLRFTYDKIFEAQGEVRPTDIQQALSDFLPASAFQEELAEEEDQPSEFKPPGEKIHEYQRNGKTYDMWCASLGDPAAKRLITNMQILVPMYIDGGSALELEHDWTTQRWKVFLVYEVDFQASSKVSPYTLIGYGTSYRNFTFPEREKNEIFPQSESLEAFLPSPPPEPNQLATVPDISSPLELPSRERLSQFLVIPPFQGAGHGQELYKIMYKHLTASDNVREFTVEDPNETFDDLRDYCDMIHLRSNFPEFAALKINTEIPADKLQAKENIPVDLIVPLAVREKLMRQTKIMPRQFDRLVEMHTLSFIPSQNRSRNRITRREKSSNEHDRAYYFWRLYVKHRLYIFNRDQLAQVEHAQRVEKLEAALDSVQEAYGEMIERVEEKERGKTNGDSGTNGVEAAVPSSSGNKKKRKVIDDDDEDEDGDAGADSEEAMSVDGQYKKLRVG